MVGALGHTCRPSSVIHLLESLGPWYTISEPWSPAQKISNDLTFLVRTRGFSGTTPCPRGKNFRESLRNLVRRAKATLLSRYLSSLAPSERRGS